MQILLQALLAETHEGKRPDIVASDAMQMDGQILFADFIETDGEPDFVMLHGFPTEGVAGQAEPNGSPGVQVILPDTDATADLPEDDLGLPMIDITPQRPVEAGRPEKTDIERMPQVAPARQALPTPGTGLPPRGGEQPEGPADIPRNTSMQSDKAAPPAKVPPLRTTDDPPGEPKVLPEKSANARLVAARDATPVNAAPPPVAAGLNDADLNPATEAQARFGEVRSEEVRSEDEARLRDPVVVPKQAVRAEIERQPPPMPAPTEEATKVSNRRSEFRVFGRERSEEVRQAAQPQPPHSTPAAALPTAAAIPPIHPVSIPEKAVSRDAPGGIELTAGFSPKDTEEGRPQPAAPSRIENASSARPVVNQIMQVMRANIDGMIEVRLHPEELGRVRLAMSQIEGGVTVHITAERHETLDLLRRNIDMLEGDLRDQGFENPSFTFGQGESETVFDETDETRSRSDTEPDTQRIQVDVVPQTVGNDGRLDIRL